MNLIEYFEQYGYISCRDRDEEKAFILKADSERINISISEEFLDEIRNDKPFSWSIDYPVVYKIIRKTSVTTANHERYRDSVHYYDVVNSGEKSIVEVDDLL